MKRLLVMTAAVAFTTAAAAAQSTPAPFLNVLNDTGCTSRYTEAKRADLFEAMKGASLFASGEVADVTDDGRVLLKVLRGTLSFDLSVTLADKRAGYDLEKGQRVMVTFTLTRHGGCFLPFGGKDGIVARR